VHLEVGGGAVEESGRIEASDKKGQLSMEMPQSNKM
jgi:hypothetical protein